MRPQGFIGAFLFNMKNKITYVLTVSKQFPKTHSRSGDSTGFVENISKLDANQSKKIHTIRANYDLWKKRIDKINEGLAVLSIRYWSGKPYNSKQVEIYVLEKVGLQKLVNPKNFVYADIEDAKFRFNAWEDLAKNDGLSFNDFSEWFKNIDDNPMAIIHFTDFKY